MVMAISKFYDKSALQTICPAAFQTQGNEKRSNRYVSVSSEVIIDSLEEANWGVNRVISPNFRKSDPNYGKHQLVFRPRDNDFTFTDPRKPDQIMFPEILVKNSFDGTTAIEFRTGLFALICGNGMVVQVSDFGSWAHHHLNFDPHIAYEIAAEYPTRIKEIQEYCNKMRERILSADERTKFATECAMIRFGPDFNGNPTALLAPRRMEDNGKDLWSTYNAIQENAMKGGIKAEKRNSRELTNLDRVNYVNDMIWAYATTYLKN